ncbi:hypothetical protein SCOCK_60249 [Actinacidiphila cocklensis]|uniref:Uncharacterized protein n=1 Tax=Actinacidiphila cocklensis TaxID=887465 RepID=A0A9W4GV37_9ACTN|nr:hypothetical protein SCOCK_60249 [Actinacidiphila cocklensis]
MRFLAVFFVSYTCVSDHMSTRSTDKPWGAGAGAGAVGRLRGRRGSLGSTTQPASSWTPAGEEPRRDSRAASARCRPPRRRHRRIRGLAQDPGDRGLRGAGRRHQGVRHGHHHPAVLRGRGRRPQPLRPAVPLPHRHEHPAAPDPHALAAAAHVRAEVRHRHLQHRQGRRQRLRARPHPPLQGRGRGRHLAVGHRRGPRDRRHPGQPARLDRRRPRRLPAGLLRPRRLRDQGCDTGHRGRHLRCRGPAHPRRGQLRRRRHRRRQPQALDARLARVRRPHRGLPRADHQPRGRPPHRPPPRGLPGTGQAGAGDDAADQGPQGLHRQPVALRRPRALHLRAARRVTCGARRPRDPPAAARRGRPGLAGFVRTADDRGVAR